MAATAIAFDNVCKSFDRGRVRAVDRVSLGVAKGEFLCIVGGSGSGKTTLLRLTNRLIEADSGTIAIDGDNIAAGDPIALRRRIGYVFQSAGLFPHMSVAENVGITPRLTGAAPGAIAARIDELLTLGGSTAQNIAAAFRTNYPAANVSVSALRVRLPLNQKIVLLDEPFGALDPLTRDGLGEDFRALHDKLGLTTIMITHDMTEAMLLADRIAVMRSGALVATGTAGELATSNEPYVRELMSTPRRQTAKLNALMTEAGARK